MNRTLYIKNIVVAWSLIPLAMLVLTRSTRAGYWLTDAVLGAGVLGTATPRLLPDAEAEAIRSSSDHWLSLGWQEGSDLLSLSADGRYYGFLSEAERRRCSPIHSTEKLTWARIRPFYFEVSDIYRPNPRIPGKSSRDISTLSNRNSWRPPWRWRGICPDLHREAFVERVALDIPRRGRCR